MIRKPSSNTITKNEIKALEDALTFFHTTYDDYDYLVSLLKKLKQKQFKPKKGVTGL